MARTLGWALVLIVMLGFGFLGGIAQAEQAAPADAPFVCGGSAGKETCVCTNTTQCKWMLDRCKAGTMSCVGPVCTCDMARKRPLAGAAVKPKASAGVDGSAGN